MATSFNFGGSNISIPDAYSRIISGVINPPQDSDFGTVLIIDTGTGAGYGVGGGVVSELEPDDIPIYSFDTINEMRNGVQGGLWWLLAKPLFRPAQIGVNGVSRVIFAKAAETEAAKITYEFTGDDDGSDSVVNGGEVVIGVRNEGLVGNGALTGGVLTRGFAAQMIASPINDGQFQIVFFRGRFKGLDSNGFPYDNIQEADLRLADRLVTSPSFSNIQQLISWMETDFVFNFYFKLISSEVTGSGLVDNADLLNNSALNLAAGGTETYDTTLVQQILDKLAKENISFILSDNFGVSAQSTLNKQVYLPWCVTQSKFKPELYVAAGNDRNDFEFSRQTCAFFDSDSCSVVHGDTKINTQLGVRTYPSIYSTAAVLGREAGLEPQIPITFKNIDINGTTYPLNDKDVERGLSSGLIMFRFQNGSFDIIKGINSLQNNRFLVNEDSTISSKQIKRITRQLNKELIIESYLQLLKNPNGVNRNSLAPEDLKSWTERYLGLKIATPTEDNLILTFEDVVVNRQQDAYFVTYRFTPNSEISFLFFTGVIINV